MRKNRQTGLSLLELMAVLTIVAILMGVGFASFKGITTSYRISGEINGLLGDMQYARSEAIKQGQSVAICVVTILQEEVEDAFMGRVFAFYDMMFNVTYVAGAAIAAAFMPKDGKSAAIVAVVAGGYAVAACGYWLSRPSAAAQRSSSAVARSLPSSPSAIRSSSM